MYVHALTIFLGSFLLFQVQPIFGKYLTPHFGGSPSVWTTCMLFFQTVLIAGYAYAHGLSYLSRRKQAYLHLGILILSLFSFPLLLPDLLPLASYRTPVATILRLLATMVGVPCLLLAASAPLIQYWFITDNRGTSPWRLYAFSNAGSLLALLSYPFLVEPYLDIDHQGAVWGWGYFVYLACCFTCAAWPLLRRQPAMAGVESGSVSGSAGKTRIPAVDLILWFACSACGSATMLAITNQICQQVATVPFILVQTLAIYLGTFILCFGTGRVYSPWLRATFLLLALVSTQLSLTVGSGLDLHWQVALFMGALVAGCMLCHGELVRLQPCSSALTLYYLTIAVGGAVGAASISLLAPLVFRSYVELPLVIAADMALFLAAAYRLRQGQGTGRWLVILGGSLLALQLVFSGYYVRTLNTDVLESSRNFYGTLKVMLEKDPFGMSLNLKHGVTTHGRQYQEKALRHYATTYYGPYTGAGLALRLHPHRLATTGGQRNLRVGIVGLGAGTLATYGEPGDVFRFYEIDPDIIRLARDRFTFLRDSDARCEVIAGDARISMEMEAEQRAYQNYDVIIIDAFNNDTIPVHLATREAVELYLRHLKADGILLFHISNRLLDLMPVFARHGEQLGLAFAEIISPGEPNAGHSAASWVILARNGAFLDNGQVSSRFAPIPGRRVDWTDRYASILKVLK